MTTTNDAMFEALSVAYPSTGQTLGDLLYAHWSAVGLQFRGSLQYDYYVAQGAVGATLGDLANDFWSNFNTVFFHLKLESGNDLLLEDGSLMLLEAGNV